MIGGPLVCFLVLFISTLLVRVVRAADPGAREQEIRALEEKEIELRG